MLKGQPKPHPVLLSLFLRSRKKEQEVNTIIKRAGLLTFHYLSPSQTVPHLCSPHLTSISSRHPFQVLMWHVCAFVVWGGISLVMGRIPSYVCWHRCLASFLMAFVGRSCCHLSGWLVQVEAGSCETFVCVLHDDTSHMYSCVTWFHLWLMIFPFVIDDLFVIDDDLWFDVIDGDLRSHTVVGNKYIKTYRNRMAW
jgi:hypothetical protein